MKKKFPHSSSPSLQPEALIAAHQGWEGIINIKGWGKEVSCCASASRMFACCEHTGGYHSYSLICFCLSGKKSWAVVETFFILFQIICLNDFLFLEHVMKVICTPKKSVCAAECVSTARWHLVCTSCAGSSVDFCKLMMTQGVALPFLGVLLVKWQGYFPSDIKPLALSESFHPVSKDCSNRKLKCRYWKEKKSCNFYIMLPLFSCVGEKKR